MDLIDSLDGVEVVDAGIKSNLVHHDDSRLLCSLVELTHRRAHIARRYDVRLALDCGLDDGGMVYVRDERNHEVVLCDCLLELQR